MSAGRPKRIRCEKDRSKPLPVHVIIKYGIGINGISIQPLLDRYNLTGRDDDDNDNEDEEEEENKDEKDDDKDGNPIVIDKLNEEMNKELVRLGHVKVNLFKCDLKRQHLAIIPTSRTMQYNADRDGIRREWGSIPESNHILDPSNNGIQLTDDEMKTFAYIYSMVPASVKNPVATAAVATAPTLTSATVSTTTASTTTPPTPKILMSISGEYWN